ncbi:hypothetical protein CHARACLAT_026690 [Characodon lateralis]|uniref:Uncharacterized protein n=1 Tax=Characodon lateralis TaxID=208331 RepID=A0ABU7CRM7_9TELE|nr:hypothetical protein [Characodon lateralis]
MEQFSRSEGRTTGPHHRGYSCNIAVWPACRASNPTEQLRRLAGVNPVFTVTALFNFVARTTFPQHSSRKRWVLMECRPPTVQSTSGSGDPDPLQLTVTFSPSVTNTLLWLTLISVRGFFRSAVRQTSTGNPSSPRGISIYNIYLQSA